MSDYNDYCEDCSLYGDDYFYNEEGELECRCPTCAFNDNDDEYGD